MKKFIIYWLPIILWASLIFYFSSVPGLASGLTVFWDVFWRKLAHASEFGILNFLIFRAPRRGRQFNFISALVLSALVTLLYAASDEWHQSFVPGREGKLSDVGIDLLGMLLFSAWLVLVNFWRKRRMAR